MTILWFGIYNPDFGRNKIYIEALKKAGHTIIECRDSSIGFIKYIKLWIKHRKIKDKYDVIVVGYPGHIVTPLARFISNKKIVVDALGSLYDAEINSHHPNFWRKIKSRFVDLLMVKNSDVILLESFAQKNYFEEKFGDSKKYSVVYTGASVIFEEKSNRIIKKISKDFTVLFRGKLTPESGIMYILKAVEILRSNPNLKFKIVGSGYFLNQVQKYIKDKNLSNVELIDRYLEDEELVRLVKDADLMLGQFEDNPRLSRTIPHKAFEAFAAKVPYITGDAPAIKEIVRDGETAFLVSLADANILAGKIAFLSGQSGLLDSVASKAYDRYKELFSIEALAKKLIEVMI